jgi:Prenyltransferase and squalene oxidase repeat
VLNWLLEEDEPSARYHALVGLQEKGQNDQLVASTQNRIGKVGWASKILSKQKENTFWDNPRSCYVPKFSACSWQLVVLADLGVSSRDPRVSRAVDHFLELHNVETGGISLRPKGHDKFEPHICLTGNMIRALAKMGYSEDGRVLRAVDWLLSKQLADGGWNCSPSGKHGSFTSVIQPVWALSEMMAHDARGGWETSAKRGAQFLLKHRIYRSDIDDSVIMLDYLRLHYPLHYSYDFLHGLRVLTELGVKNDPRMNDAVSLLLEKRLPDGKWLLDGVYRGWRHAHAMHGEETVSRPEERELITEGWGTERALQIEEAGRPSKWITLQALLALKRLGLLAPGL